MPIDSCGAALNPLPELYAYVGELAKTGQLEPLSRGLVRVTGDDPGAIAVFVYVARPWIRQLEVNDQETGIRLQNGEASVQRGGDNGEMQ